MLTRPVDYERALANPHRVVARVDVHSGTGGLLQSDLPFVSGSVSATLTSRVARQLSLSVNEAYYPVLPTDLLGPFGNELRAYRGIEYGDGFQALFPVFRGRINSADLSDSGVSIRCVDRAGDISDAGFEVPHLAVAGPVVDEFRRLILEVFPEADIDIREGFGERTPNLIWESDRAKACDDLANAAGAFWYPLADGTFTLRRVPWAHISPALYVLHDGPGGTVVRSQVSRTRDNVYNSITVLAERTDGSAPVRYTARDADPTSPTYFLGGYGLRARQVSVQTAVGEGQAQGAAETLLRRSRALTETWRIDCIPDASIELGDTILLQARGREMVQVISGFSLPLTATGTMSIDLRTQGEEVEGA